MDSKVIRIGTSLGVIIPNMIAKDTGIKLGSKINISKTKKNQIVINRNDEIRKGWAEKFKAYAEEGEDEKLLPDYLDYEADKLL